MEPILETNLDGKTCVTVGGHILFTGGRVAVMRFVKQHCITHGINRWFYRNSSGFLVEIPVKLKKPKPITGPLRRLTVNYGGDINEIRVIECNGREYFPKL